MVVLLLQGPFLCISHRVVELQKEIQLFSCERRLEQAFDTYLLTMRVKLLKQLVGEYSVRLKLRALQHE